MFSALNTLQQRPIPWLLDADTFTIFIYVLSGPRHLSEHLILSNGTTGARIKDRGEGLDQVVGSTLSRDLAREEARAGEGACWCPGLALLGSPSPQPSSKLY